MPLPRPGKPVRGSRTGRPVMALLDLLGRRMTLRILWELSRADAPLTFRALQGAADTNPALLNTRLKELRAAGLVVHGGEGYSLSKDGQALLLRLLPLVDWADQWAAGSK
jgi:DNA-binding HxlR family transcriptional regulator